MTEEHAADPNSGGREYSGRESNTYLVVIPASDPLSFTDRRRVQSRFLVDAKANKISPEHALLAAEATRSLVEDFFGKYLQGDSAPHLDLPVRVDKR